MNRICGVIVAWAVLASSLSTFAQDPDLRQEVCLNGTWELHVEGISQAATVRVPGSYAGQDQMVGKEHSDVWSYPPEWRNKAVTYQRSFDVPESLKGRRVLIHFGGVRHKVRVEVNGVEAGTWWDSYVPFEFDITGLVKPGKNELKVHVGKEDSVLFEDWNAWRRGIYRDVFLKIVPDVHVTPDLFVRTSVARGEIACDIPVRNDSDGARKVRLRFNVTDADGRTVKAWQAPAVTLEPGAVTVVKSVERWTDPHLWSLTDPYLQHLNTEVVDESGVVLDRHRLRFGFREITTDKNRLLLNGNELFLRGNGDHPIGDLEGGREFSMAKIRMLKENGMEIMRMHNLPRHAELYDAGDELGFLFISEASHHFRLPEPEIGKAHMSNLIRWLRNRPSVALWSVSNELHWRKIEEPKYLIDLCHELDPTRPAYASDFSPWSLHGDVISKHYSAATVWEEWFKYGPDKPMIWDEFAETWQPQRPFRTGPAGYEVTSQDVGAGTWGEGWMQVRGDLKHCADGKEHDGRFYRVTAWVPWEFGYNFFRFQPFNNFNQMPVKHAAIEGERGIKIEYVNPCANTVNIWDPTLPFYQPNPGFYCFEDYLRHVRFPDDPKDRTFFSGATIEQRGRLFYEDHRPTDKVEFRVETTDGNVLTTSGRAIKHAPGAYVPEFVSTWTLPKVDVLTPVRLVRQFSFNGVVGYRQVRDVKIFPQFDVEAAGKTMAVVPSLQKAFKGPGVDEESAKVIVTDSLTPELKEKVRKGKRVLVLNPLTDKSRKVTLSRFYLPLTSKPDLNLGPEISVMKPSETKVSLFGKGGTMVQIRSQFNDMAILNSEPGAWVKFEFPHVVGLDSKSSLKFTYSLWMPPDPTYEEGWKKVGGASHFQKSARLLVQQENGQWLGSQEDAIRFEAKGPGEMGGEAEACIGRMTWHEVTLEPGKPLVIGKPVTAPVFENVSSFGFEITRSQKNVALCLKEFQIEAKKLASAVVPSDGPQHPLLTGLGAEDFSFWRGGNACSKLALPQATGFRRILFGDSDGSDAVLQEFAIGQGLVLECSLNVLDTLGQEPVAGHMLQRMLEYLGQYRAVDEAPPVAVIGSDSTVQYWQGLGLSADKVSDPKSLKGRNLVIVESAAIPDGGDLEAWRAALQEVVTTGGTVFWTSVDEAQLAKVRKLAGLATLRLTEPFFGKRSNCIKAPVSWMREGTPQQWVDYYEGVLVPYPFERNFSPLLAGIANQDLQWDGVTMLDKGIEIEGMNPVTASGKERILISTWHIGSESGNGLYDEWVNGVRDLRQNAWFVNRDPVLLQVQEGKGSNIFCQLALSAGGHKADRLMTQLFSNMGAPFAGSRPLRSDLFDPAPSREQAARFTKYDTQISPAVRQYYGKPDPMPDYLAPTQIDEATSVQLPVLGLVGDPLAVSLAAPLAKALEGIQRLDTPVSLSSSKDAAGPIPDRRWDRVVLSMGAADLEDASVTPARFAADLAKVHEFLQLRARQIFWLPIGPQVNPERQARADALNEAAAKYFEKRNVYQVPFVYNNASEVLRSHLSAPGRGYSEEESRALAKGLAEAVQSFGGQ
ncbi:MAG: hypothetical protein NTV93_20140 [Verrucomicrobia bacterium]|nr:hypothetical protein [Verrucomicrobiota bacterium]